MKSVLLSTASALPVGAIKLAIVVGHNERQQGAVRQDTGESEYSWNTRLAAFIVELSRDFPQLAVKVFHRKYMGSYRRELTEVYGRVDAWGADYSVELHFNSHTTASATGTEVLSSGSKGSLRLCHALQDEMLDALGLKDRGTKVVRTGRGSLSLIVGRAAAALLEPFFASSPLGLAATDTEEEMRNLARAVLRGVTLAAA